MNKSSSNFFAHKLGKGKSRNRKNRRHRKNQQQRHSWASGLQSEYHSSFQHNDFNDWKESTNNYHTNSTNSHCPQFPQSSNLSSTSPSNPLGFELWRKTYENLIKCQMNYQKDYWKNLALNLKNENDILREKLRKFENEKPENDIEAECSSYITSSDSED